MNQCYCNELIQIWLDFNINLLKYVKYMLYLMQIIHKLCKLLLYKCIVILYIFMLDYIYR